jgi:acyl carrier protein
MKQDLLEATRTLVAEATRRNASTLAPDDDLVLELGLDSLEGLRVLALAEKRFGVRFDDAELHDMRTLRRIADAVARRRET